jgi:hypothetical protein
MVLIKNKSIFYMNESINGTCASANINGITIGWLQAMEMCQLATSD